jgi:hypothetical protein
MPNRPNYITSCQYLWITCAQCDQTVKVAKHKGAEWKLFGFLPAFLLEHAECSPDALRIEAK